MLDELSFVMREKSNTLFDHLLLQIFRQMPMLFVIHGPLEVFKVLLKQVGEEFAMLSRQKTQLSFVRIRPVVICSDSVVVDAKVAKQVQNCHDLLLI